ncbi:uncharacterized protein LOC106082586 [Stomoxys calcitrans]|uniref:Uncharacterized protein n=1 Tax=Stomoxys calcitrans TaxID=35570 RepID=A0A1I8NWF8_STOCA|nr:uncharacterized protein LOC106082586 [Stomoxys calcitrans]
MALRYLQYFALGYLVLATANAAAIESNSVGEPRIKSSEDLLSNIMDNCLNANGMTCLQERVLTYLDGVAGVKEDVSGRAFSDDVMDTLIVDRVARVLNQNELRMEMPDASVISYRADRGFDLEVPQTEARKKKNKDKLTTSLLLIVLLKSIIMPILMILIKLKTYKAMILSKLAIKLVLGFIFYNLYTKLSGTKMTVTPVSAAIAYDRSSTSSWEASNPSPYARSDAQYLAYNSYQ